MDKQSNSSIMSSASEILSSFVGLILSYYSDLVSHPLRNGLIYFLAGLMGSLFVGWILFPIALYSSQQQPINFSHELHMDPDITEEIEADTDVERCLYCHVFRKDGTFAGIPRMERCKECHDDARFPLGETAGEEKFLKEYMAKGKEVPWLPYYRQPDSVYFSHIPHIKRGELECEECHGVHPKTDILPLYKKNRLSGYSINIYGKRLSGVNSNFWDRLKMDECAQCHTDKGFEENTACFVCHK